MKKTVIVYKTIYGSTKKYALWLGKDLKCKVFEMDSFKNFKTYSHFIVMSGTYAGKMPLTGFLKRNWEQLKDKKITIIAVGMAPENNWWSKLSYIRIPKKIRKKAKYFKIKGRFKEQGEPIKKSNLKRVITYIKK
jgi:menaquinone-dependent protoporphyrinogen IX oxidase